MGTSCFEFLLIGCEDQNGVVVRFAEGPCMHRGSYSSNDLVYCLHECLVVKFALLKYPATINAASGDMVSSLHKVQ